MNREKTAGRKTIIFLAAVFLLICGVFILSGCGRTEDPVANVPVMNAAPEDPVKALSKQELIEQIAVNYGAYGAEAEEKNDELLKELSSKDADTAERLKKIMQIWSSGELGKNLNYDVLPDGLPDTDELCIVVLGFKLNSDGTMQEELIGRLTTALNSAIKYPNSYIVCTGGGTASKNKTVTEAGEMARWLMAHGIDEKRIIVEDKSATTAQNAILSLDILEKDYLSVDKIAIVSSDYHIETGEFLFDAEAVIRAEALGKEKYEVVSNAAWKAPKGSLSTMFQAGAIIELFGDVETAFEIYYENYDIHELPPLD